VVDDTDWTKLLVDAGFTRGRDELWEDRRGYVGAVLSGVGLLLGWIDVGWDGPATPYPRLRDVTHLGRPLSKDEVARAATEARTQRKRALRNCRFCREACIPGHMHSDDVCQGCAERHLHVDY
jgi:hypothetical protein